MSAPKPQEDRLQAAAFELWNFLENVVGFCDCTDGGACITNAEHYRLNELVDSLGAALGVVS